MLCHLQSQGLASPWREEGERRASFCACKAPPPWHWATLAGSASMQLETAATKNSLEGYKKQEWGKAFNV